MEKDLISIVIPVRNGEKTLEGCVRSAAAQTYGNTEILIMENGSEDGTSAVCEKLAAEYGNVSVFHLDTNGVSAARNAGLEQVRGEYVTFLDADDRLSPRFLEFLFNCLTEEHADIAGCSLILQSSPPGELFEKSTDSGIRKIYSGEEYIKEAFLNGNVRVCTKLFRTSLISEQRFPEDLTIGEDLVFFLRVLDKDTRIITIDNVLYWYYYNRESAMNRPYVPAYQDQIRCWNQAEELLCDKFPSVMAEPGAEAKLKRIQCVAALLVAVKLGKLDRNERKKYREEFEEVRERIRELTDNGQELFDMKRGQKLRVFLLLHFERLFILSCRMKNTYD
ncbi:MAG: glycosyltransferase family 2 protein [Lachnospiraceae bacterium]|nr:glycosyltransferase family 2 protein [Lachnospiraceae bacterium]